jgi:hypothetical protein
MSAAKDRQFLLEYNRKNVLDYYRQAKNDGMEKPVVYVLDLNDSLGREIGTAVIGNDSVEEMVKHCGDKSTPTAFACLPFTKAIMALRGHVATADKLSDEAYDANFFYVVCIGFEGTAIACWPSPE